MTVRLEEAFAKIRDAESGNTPVGRSFSEGRIRARGGGGEPKYVSG
jgi:hypothetical protein